MLDETRQETHSEALNGGACLVSCLVLVKRQSGSRDVCPTYRPQRPLRLESCSKITYTQWLEPGLPLVSAGRLSAARSALLIQAASLIGFYARNFRLSAVISRLRDVLCGSSVIQHPNVPPLHSQ